MDLKNNFELRKEEFKVGYDPIVNNPYHGEIWCSFSENKAAQKLKHMAVWFVPIHDINLL